MFLKILLYVVGIIYILSGIRVIYQWEDGLLFQLGRYKSKRKPGLTWVEPITQRLVVIDKRIRTIDVKPQECITRDSVPVEIDAVIYFRVKDSEKAVINVEDFEEASYKLAQTVLRDVIGKKNLDEVLAKKDEIGKEIMKIIQEPTDEWGIEITNVEIKDISLPKDMKRALAKEAEAIREKRARIIKAEAELEASKKFGQASSKMNDKAMMLRQLQTWQEIGAEKNSTIIVVPSDLGIRLFK